jgi:glycosyltransferase involved in cell wall biosynthesis
MINNIHNANSTYNLRIAIKVVQMTIGGGLTHLNKIIEWFGRLAPDVEFVLLAKKGQEKLFIQPPDNFRYIYYKLPSLNLPAQLFWERQILPGILTNIKADLLFEPGNRGTLQAPIPKVSLIHNVAPFEKQFRLADTLYKRLRLVFLRKATIESMNASQGIIFISKTSRDAISKYIDLASIKTSVIYHGRMENNHSMINKQSPPDFPSRYLLCVSHIYRYKKIYEMVQAYFRAKILVPDIPPLLIAGANYAPQYMDEIKEEINRSGHPDSIRFLGNLPENKLMTLYQNCEAFIFPSALEACPNILIEAMSCGCAIACSDKGVMPEIASDAVLYFNPDNIEDYSTKIISVVNDIKLRAQLSQRAKKRAEYFSWEKTSRETLGFFNDVLGKPQRTVSLSSPINNEPAHNRSKTCSMSLTD